MHDAKVTRYSKLNTYVVECTSCGVIATSYVRKQAVAAADEHAIVTAIQNIVDALAVKHSLATMKVVMDGKLGHVLGRAHLLERILKLNPTLLHHSATLDNTIRHEVAHFYAWDNFGNATHDDTWKHCATILGAQPLAMSHVSIDDDAAIVAAHGMKYRYECALGCATMSRKPRPALISGKRVCLKHRMPFVTVTKVS